MPGRTNPAHYKRIPSHDDRLLRAERGAESGASRPIECLGGDLASGGVGPRNAPGIDGTSTQALAQHVIGLDDWNAFVRRDERAQPSGGIIEKVSGAP